MLPSLDPACLSGIALPRYQSRVPSDRLLLIRALRWPLSDLLSPSHADQSETGSLLLLHRFKSVTQMPQ